VEHRKRGVKIQFLEFLCLIQVRNSAYSIRMQSKGIIRAAFHLPAFFTFFLLAATVTSQAQVVLQIGRDDNTHLRTSTGGGTNANFMQENGSVNPLPGVPNSPVVDRQVDNDYYLAGTFTSTIPGVISFYGDYTPIGVVSVNEEAAERAFVPGDDDLRYHFNLPNTLQPTDLLSVTFDALDLHTGGSDPRWGIEVYFNGVLVQPQIVIRPAQLNVDYTTPQFTLASVNAQVGPGFDNIISLKGITYTGSGGGDWMGIDYVQLNAPTSAIPVAVFPWGVGKNDNTHPVNLTGGGTNANFVQEDGTVNPLPGSPFNVPTIPASKSADNDYYFAGSYTTVIASNVSFFGTNYTPVGLVMTNEEAAERAFAGGDTELRYHFNLPNTAGLSDRFAVSFDALDLDTSGNDPRWGVEVYFNGVRVQSQVIIRPAQLGQKISTLPFTLASVGAVVGAGFDNIVSLRGINYGGSGGGQWMGIDYVQLEPATNTIPPAVFPWSVGKNDDGWPGGDSGGTNAAFVDEDTVSNPLPGFAENDEFGFLADDDYYFAGAYTTVIPGNGTYEPIGVVPVNEDAAAKGFSGTDNDLRYHFNLPASLPSNAVLSVTFDALGLDTNGPADPRYGVEVYFNGVLIQTQVVIRPAQLGQAISTARFTAASVNAQGGPGFDNIIRLRGFNYGATGGGDSLGLDYISLNVHPQSPFPWMVGRDDGAWPAGNGGGPNTSFVQENGSISALPGRSDNPEVNQQSDNDYYFAGDYTTTIPSAVAYHGPYTPLGSVLANEEGAERAFAGGDRELRYHFNLPASLSSSDTLSITFDANNLDTDNGGTPPPPPDPRWGVEVYFNGVLVQTQIVIRPAQLDVDYTTPEFTLASVNAQVGPGFDNIVSLRGISYNGPGPAEGGGNWMGIDYVQLNGPQPLAFLPIVRTNGQVRLNWTSTGYLERAPTILGPWTPITPAPTPPYFEAITPTNRFYRLSKWPQIGHW
jgi:hypothetical protein